MLVIWQCFLCQWKGDSLTFDGAIGLIINSNMPALQLAQATAGITVSVGAVGAGLTGAVTGNWLFSMDSSPDDDLQRQMGLNEAPGGSDEHGPGNIEEISDPSNLSGDFGEEQLQ